MRDPWRRPGWITTTLVAALALGVPSCTSDGTDGSAEMRSGTVEFAIALQDGLRWRATGSLVDQGVVCPDGFGRDIARLDPVTRTPISGSEYVRRVEELSRPGEPVDLILVAQWTCADGSGTFVVELTPTGSPPRIVSGTGAYATVDGTGEDRGTFDLGGIPDTLIVTLQLELGPDAAG